ncbi:interaptin isoform X2 [Drosophila mojavensis]|uniref:interaptin isoform X2 n=1 Tax=Drosophila mojavensis TaxID=7230 RepID=UPI0013EEB9FC|nr:interaptin isoform X2 [Drosophila mojavensis]
MAVTNLPRVPEGLRDLVKTYTKEVLREKPKDLYKFSVDYFENLAGTRKIQRKVMKYESQQSYETIMKNRTRQQIPLSLAFHIIPENLTEVIKQFIKAVLRENPQYLVLFAIDYFKNLQASSSKLGDIQYTAYEKFMEKNESKSPARKVTKCECGRILSSTGGRPEVIQNDTPDEDQQFEKFNKNDQYIKAVYIIQKYIRQYLKHKAEKSSQVKVTSKSADIYGSQEVLNAILIIQRQFRRLIIKKRSKASAETKQTNEGRYDSLKYMKATLIIQRYMREYFRKKKSKKQALTKSKDSTPDNNISMTTAAFVIQRAFRRMVRARRGKRHINADLDQCDEMNDNASEAASYTSASTALLSTESAGEHDFGSTNEEGVHQQTIKEDEEVENDDTNRKMIFGTDSIKTNTKSASHSGEAKNNNDNFNETEDEQIDKHFGTKTCNELEKPTTDNDISKNLQLGKIGHDENIKIILIEESTNPSNIDILEPEQHKANTIQFRNEILTLETTSDLGNQNSRARAVSSSVSNNENVATTHSDLIDDENRNETQLAEHSEKHLLKTDEFKKSSIIKRESLNDDNRIFESAQTIEMDGLEDHNVITSNNVTKESIPESSSKIQSLKSLTESEKISSPSGSDIELVSKITTELKASSESLKTRLLSTDILDLEQNVDQKPLDSIITTLEERSADSSSKATKPASLESNYDKSANQNHPISPTLKSVESDNDNLINQITDDIINNNPITNQVNDTVDENINKLTTVAEIPVDPQILTVNDEINSDAITNSQTNNGSDKINSDAITENTLNENEKTEESKVDPGNIMVEESLTKSSFQESLESKEYESIKTLEPSNSFSSINKQNSEIPTDAITESTVTEIEQTEEIKSNPSNILEEESLTKSSIQERLESQENEKKKSASTNSVGSIDKQYSEIETDAIPKNTSNENEQTKKIKVDKPNSEISTDAKTLGDLHDLSPIATDIVDQEQGLDQNKITNISNAAPDHCQNASTDTKNTQSLESANDNIGDQNPQQKGDNENSITRTASDSDTKNMDDGDDPISPNKSTSEIQYSIEVNSLQTVLKNLHSQAKNTNNDALSENTTSDIADTLSNSESNEKLFDDLGTSIIIHSVLPTEDDYELTIVPPSKIALLETLDGNITESSDLNIIESQSITESTTSADDLTVIEFQKPSEVDISDNKPPKKTVDEIVETSSSVNMSEEQNSIQNDHLLPPSTEKDAQITVPDNIVTDKIDEKVDNFVENDQIPDTEINPPSSNEDSNEPGETNINIIPKVVQKESFDEIDSKTENEKEDSIPLQEPEDTQQKLTGMDTGMLRYKDVSMDKNSLTQSEAEAVVNISSKDENTAQNALNNLLEPEGIQVEQNIAPSDMEIEANKTESLKSEIDSINHNENAEKKNENIKSLDNTSENGPMKVIPNESSDGSKNEDLISDNKPSLPLSNQLIGSQISKTASQKIKKMSNVKDKQLSNHTSNRLLQTPIAELQLKSFKNSTDEGSWYEAYTEPNELNMNTNESSNAKESDQQNALLEEIKSSKNIERSPSYINGAQDENNDPVKPKQSICYFISFDGNDDRTSFKIPKKFLRQSEYCIKKNRTKCNKSKISLDEENLDDSVIELSYQEFVTPKLQTIQELNENEVSTELKVDTDKSVANVQADFKEIEDITSNIENEPIPGSHDNNKQNQNRPTELDGQNLCSSSDNIQLTNSANIIKRAYRAYKIRKSRDDSDEVNGLKDSKTADNEMLDDSKTTLNPIHAAIKIQKSFRKAAQKAPQIVTQESPIYMVSEVVAAIRIQNAFRDYIRRKERSKPEWFVGSQPISLLSSASSVPAAVESLVATTDDKIDSPTPESDHNSHIELSNLDAQSNGSLELATDIDNIVNDLYSNKVFETDNGDSKNLAGLANDEVFDSVEDVGAMKSSYIERASTEGATMRELLNEFIRQEIQFSYHTDNREHNKGIEEVHEIQCVKRTVSLSNLDEDKSDNDGPENIKEDKLQHLNESESELDTLDSAALKLSKADQIIEKMSRRRSSEIREKQEKEDCNIKDSVFDEPLVQPMSDLQGQNSLDIEDGDIVYKRLQRDETRESSAQSESVIFGNADEDRAMSNDPEIARSQLSRHYTIAGDDPKTIFKSVIITDSVKYIDDENENAIDGSKGSSSFCLDDETSENIRKKMMAYSLSEADSDYCDPNKIMKDDFHIDTAMADAMDTSTETESTIVSAAAKIQAGARGFLTRRRLRRASAGTKSSTQETKASFGNDAISESLERFIEEEAAKKIQTAYRLHTKKPKHQALGHRNGSSLESTLAAKRQMLQRGDALQNDSNSSPENENTDGISEGQLKKPIETISSPNKGTRSIKRADMRLNWPVLRQNSMPVQIECEVLRVIPKHRRRRIRSAQDKNKKN